MFRLFHLYYRIDQFELVEVSLVARSHRIAKRQAIDFIRSMNKKYDLGYTDQTQFTLENITCK